MAENKTKFTGSDVGAFLDAVEPEARREDARALCAIMTRLSGEEARMWGSSIVGFGSYHYHYDSGHQGEAPRLGFSPRKSSLVIYIVPGLLRYAALMERLGKHKTGKSCLYINKLADIDAGALEELVAASLAEMRALSRKPKPFTRLTGLFKIDKPIPN